MRPDLCKQLLPFDEALRLTLEAARPVERTETVPVADAVGRVAAADVVSTVDVPAFDRAAMDGYAVRSVDVADAAAATPVALTCIDHIFTGRPSERSVCTWKAPRSHTGASAREGTTGYSA